MASYDRERQIKKILDTNNTGKFFIEYLGGRFNHLSHAVYALDKLQAPLEDIENFVRWMAEEKLEDPEHHKTRTNSRPTDLSYYDHYEEYKGKLKDVYSGSIELMIKGEFPKLSSGMMSSALHGLIHIGYGYASSSDWFVCEGFAFLKCINVPFLFKEVSPKLDVLGSGSKHILEVLNAAREDKDLKDISNQATTNRVAGPKFPQIAKYLIDHGADRIAEFVHQIKFPDHLTAQEFNIGKLPELTKWLIDCSTIVYAIVSKKNDFFLLHGVTGSWSLAQILPLLGEKEDMLSAVHTFLCCLLVVYVARNSPPLDMSLLEQNDGMTHEWPDLIQKAVVHQDHEREHQFKLVQVCKDMSDINNDPVMESIYRLAAYKCVTHPYDF